MFLMLEQKLRMVEEKQGRTFIEAVITSIKGVIGLQLFNDLLVSARVAAATLIGKS